MKILLPNKRYQLVYFQGNIKCQMIDQKKNLLCCYNMLIERVMKTDSQTKIKFLHRRFSFFKKKQIRIIYEFCEQNLHKTEKIITIVRDTKCSQSITKILLEKPEKAAEMLSNFEKRYDTLYSIKENQIQKKQSSQTTKNQKNISLSLIPRQILYEVFLFLDPYSFFNIALTSKIMKRFTQMQIFDEYYRILCVNIFVKIGRSLPKPCRFSDVQDFIVREGNFFGPNTRRAVRNNVRNYIWQKQLIVQKIKKHELNHFSNFKNIFYLFPRIHLNGFYICKHQYRKEQDKNLLTNTNNAHFVSYFRYFRFFEDGSVLSLVFHTKQNNHNVYPLLSNYYLNPGAVKQNKKLMLGEYIQKQNNVEVKLYKQGAIFTYFLEIVSFDDNSIIKNALLVKSYHIKVIDDKNQIEQVLQTYNPHNPMIFKYHFIRNLKNQNSKYVQSSCL